MELPIFLRWEAEYGVSAVVGLSGVLVSAWGRVGLASRILQGPGGARTGGLSVGRAPGPPWRRFRRPLSHV